VVKLFDFGLSREIESTLRTAVKVGGTPNWQAPETWSELTCTSSTADVYAFGCVLIELFGQFREPGCFPWMQFKRSDKASRKHIKNQVKNHQAKPPELDLVDDPAHCIGKLQCRATLPHSSTWGCAIFSKEESARTNENKRPLDGSRRPPSKAMSEHSCV